LSDQPDGTSGKASGAGGTGFKFRANQISYTLPMTCHRCNLEVWALVQPWRWAPLTRDTRKGIKQ